MIYQIFYSNYWLTKSKWMHKYIDFCTKYIELLDDKTNNNLQIMLNSDIGYTTAMGASLSEDQLVKICGFPYYTHHAFVMGKDYRVYFSGRMVSKEIQTMQIQLLIQLLNRINFIILKILPKIYLISHQMDYSGAPIYLCKLMDYFKNIGCDVTLFTRRNGNLSGEYPSIEANKYQVVKIIMEQCFDTDNYAKKNKDLANSTSDQLLQHAVHHGNL